MIPTQLPVKPRLLALVSCCLLAVVPSSGFIVPMIATRSPNRLSTCSHRDTGGEHKAGRLCLLSVSSPGFRTLMQRNTAKVLMLANPLPETPDSPPSNPEKPLKLVYSESAMRSFVKALAWRLTAAVVTLISGLVFSGSLSTAMSIVGSDFVTKSGFMFLGERLWNKVKWGQGTKGDSTQRSLAKAILWRVFAAANTLICGAFLARDLSVASKIAGTDTVCKTGLFFLNERIWNSIRWGKQFEPEYFI